MSYDQLVTTISGDNKGDILMFTLSTCIWCKKTKALLAELGVAYRFVDVDLLDGPEREEVMTEFVAKNPETSFPTIVIDGEMVILGFQEEEIRHYVASR